MSHFLSNSLSLSLSCFSLVVTGGAMARGGCGGIEVDGLRSGWGGWVEIRVGWVEVGLEWVG